MMKPLSIFRSLKRLKRKDNRDRDGNILPLYHQNCCSSSRRDIVGRIYIHIIPLLVLLCLIILWWFSYPVNLVVKDGRITVVSYSDVQMPKFINETHVDFAFLAAIATPPYNSNSHMQPRYNQNIAELVSGIE